ncbi:MAG: DUF2061 domain-containing protein [Sedimentisphaerales bacterium]|jgi:uncharacterized membrane protein|nr:DUF2061 domain-containing protein [Sedimentisphaerales bacterium]
MDTHLRSILKAVSYRVMGSAVTVVIAWVVTSQIALAAQIGVADTLVKILPFYVHERIWQRVPLGRKEGPEYEI